MQIEHTDVVENGKCDIPSLVNFDLLFLLFRQAFLLVRLNQILGESRVVSLFVVLFLIIGQHNNLCLSCMQHF